MTPLSAKTDPEQPQVSKSLVCCGVFRIAGQKVKCQNKNFSVSSTSKGLTRLWVEWGVPHRTRGRSALENQRRPRP